MKTITRIIMTCLCFLITISFAASSEASKASKQDPTGTPPYGVAVQNDAQGIKLTGTATIEYYNFRGESGMIADGRISVRLRKGNIVKVLYGEVEGVDLSLQTATQTAIITEMKSRVIQEFFNNDTSLQVTLKGLEEFAGTDTDVSTIYMMDIVIAVK